MAEYKVVQNTGDDWRITRRPFVATVSPSGEQRPAWYLTVEQKQWLPKSPGQTRRKSHYVTVEEIPVAQIHYGDLMEQLRLNYDMRHLTVRDMVVPDLSSPPEVRRSTGRR